MPSKRSKSVRAGDDSPITTKAKKKEANQLAIISEDELSVCKSEGSPPKKSTLAKKKKDKARVTAGRQPVFKKSN
jgi:hypothetical protein